MIRDFLDVFFSAIPGRDVVNLDKFVLMGRVLYYSVTHKIFPI